MWISLGDAKRGPNIDEHQDERFLLALLQKIKQQYQVRKAFLCGFSSGVKMSHHLHILHADKFDGFGFSGKGIRDMLLWMARRAQSHAARPRLN